MPANNPLAYGRILLDILFTRQELKESILFKHFKSAKPPLDRQRVDLLFSKFTCRTSEYKLLLFFYNFVECVRNRFPELNEKELVRNLNQKCRDSGKIKETNEEP